jgi:hypothetical protein
MQWYRLKSFYINHDVKTITATSGLQNIKCYMHYETGWLPQSLLG